MRDAAAREQGDLLGAEEPRRALGCVARVGVLGQQDQQPAPELLVQRREDERQRRLRDARAAGQRLRECLEALARRELRDEGVKGRRVHANGGKRAPRGYRSGAPPAAVPNLPQGHPRAPTGTLAGPSRTGLCRPSCRCATAFSTPTGPSPTAAAQRIARMPADRAADGGRRPRAEDDRRLDRRLRGSVEAALRLVETDRDERLDRVGRARDDRGLGVVLGRERRRARSRPRRAGRRAPADRRRRAAGGTPGCRAGRRSSGGRCGRRGRRRAVPGGGRRRGRPRRGRRAELSSGAL